MSDQRMPRHGDRRAFRPTLDGRLETRVLLAASAIRAQTASGGQAVVVTIPDGERFFVSVQYGGTVRATPASNGRVNLSVDGTNSGSLLEINRILPKQVKGTAHTFDKSLAGSVTKLNIASIKVTTGSISAIEGYQTANLSGPITVNGSTRVDRIALNSILPGGSIQVSGDLNTLDIYRDVQLTSPTGISVGRDLSWFEAYGNVSITNGSTLTVGRDLGANFQPAKGTGNAGQGVNITGNLAIDPGSSITVTRNFAPPAGFVVTGNLTGAANITIGGLPLGGTSAVVPGVSTNNNLGVNNGQPLNFLIQGTVTA